MTAEEALNQYFAASGILAPGCTRSDWYPGHFVYLDVGPAKVPLLPILRRSGPVVSHDLHHMLTGCAPDWPGEVELAGWELASGGCGWHFLYWLDRVLVFALGLVTAPRALWAGLRAGRGRRNLYRADREEVLHTDVERVRARLGL